MSAELAQQLFIKTVPLMTEDAELAATQQTEQWTDFECLIKTTLDITENLVHRSLARRPSNGLLGDFYKAGMTEEEATRTIGSLSLREILMKF